VQGDDDAVVVGDIGGGKHTALAVLEPLGTDLVDADRT
jgi:dephospho-CoA kinase